MDGSLESRETAVPSVTEPRTKVSRNPAEQQVGGQRTATQRRSLPQDQWPDDLLSRLMRARDEDTGQAMAENLLPFLFWGLAQGQATGHWPQANDAQFTGASPRYRIYRTACGRHLAAAPLENKFWQAFCEAIGLPAAHRDDALDPAATIEAVSRRLAEESADHWEGVFRAADCCVSVVRTLDEAVRDLHLAARGVFGREVRVEGHVLQAMPVALVRSLRRRESRVGSPALGEARIGDLAR